MSSTNQTTETGERIPTGSLPRPMATITLHYDGEADVWRGALRDHDDQGSIERIGREELDVLNELIDDYTTRPGKKLPHTMEVRLFA